VSQFTDRKVALVTGGSSGIGKATAIALAKLGATVVIVADTNLDGLKETVRIIEAGGGKAAYRQMNVSSGAEVGALVDYVVNEFGPLACAVNNAGIEGKPCFTADIVEDDWDKVLNVNLKGVWLCMKHEIRAMLKQGAGNIVNVSSAGGVLGLPYWAAYSASKHGVVGLTRTAALEYAKSGIRINAVCPGFIYTPLLDRITGKQPAVEAALQAASPMGRIGKPEEVAATIVPFCTDATSYVTGAVLMIDGAMTSGKAP